MSRIVLATTPTLWCHKCLGADVCDDKSVNEPRVDTGRVIVEQGFAREGVVRVYERDGKDIYMADLLARLNVGIC
jgi:hypothetical protein